MLFPLNNYNDVIRAVNEFDKVKPALQKHRWMVIESTLAKLDKTVEVEVDNPINKFDTRRVICKESKNNNNIFKNYINILQNDVEDFNNIVYNRISNTINSKDSMKTIFQISREYNRYADELIIKYYPHLKPYCEVLRTAVYKIVDYFFKSMNLEIINNILDDIEFIINSNVLCSSHIERYTFIFKLLISKSLYSNLLDNNTKDRILAITIVDCDNFYTLPSNKMYTVNINSLLSYLKIRKRDYEMDLVYNDLNSDYNKVNLYVDDIDKSIERIFNQYITISGLFNIDDVDVLKLNNKGFSPIFHYTKFAPTREYNIYFYIDPKTKLKYVVLKTKNKDEYLFINKDKKFNVQLKFNSLKESLNEILESTITITDKYNNF